MQVNVVDGQLRDISIFQHDLLHTLIRANEVEKLREAIAAGHNIEQRIEGRTPILEAAEYLRQEAFMVMLHAGAKLDVKDKLGSTLIHLCAGNDWSDVCRLLVDKGLDVNAKADSLRTPLHYWASKKKSEATCAVLSRAGADFNAKDEDGMTPVDEAVYWDNKEGARIIIAYGSRADTSNEELNSLTAKQAAAQAGLTGRMLELLESEGPVNPLKDDPQLLANMAANHGHPETAAAVHSFMAKRVLEATIRAATRQNP